MCAPMHYRRWTGRRRAALARCCLEAILPAWRGHCLARALDRVLAAGVGGRLVRAEAFERRRPQLVVLGPFQVLDLADQLRADEAGPAGSRGALEPLELGLAHLELLESFHQVSQERVGEPGADVAGVAQPAVVVDGQQQRAEGGLPAALARGPADDHAVLEAQGLDLAPVMGTEPRPVGARCP